MRVEGQVKEINLVCECLKWSSVINKIFECEKCNNSSCVVKRKIEDKVNRTDNPIGCVNCNTCKNPNCSLYKYRVENRAKEMCEYFEEQEQYIDENSKDFGKLSIYSQ